MDLRCAGSLNQSLDGALKKDISTHVLPNLYDFFSVKNKRYLKNASVFFNEYQWALMLFLKSYFVFHRRKKGK